MSGTVRVTHTREPMQGTVTVVSAADRRLEVVTAVCREMYLLAADQDDQAAAEAARTPYWAPEDLRVAEPVTAPDIRDREQGFCEDGPTTGLEPAGRDPAGNGEPTPREEAMQGPGGEVELLGDVSVGAVVRRSSSSGSPSTATSGPRAVNARGNRRGGSPARVRARRRSAGTRSRTSGSRSRSAAARRRPRGVRTPARRAGR